MSLSAVREVLIRITELSSSDQDLMIAALARLLTGHGGADGLVAVDRALSASSHTTRDQPLGLISTTCSGDAGLTGRPADPAGLPRPRKPLGPAEVDRVQKAMQFLEEHASVPLSSGPVSLDRVAAHVGWSKWHCARVFKRHTGTGVAEFSRTIRVRRARQLLAETSLSVKEVAAAAGFTYPSDLTRCFLRAYGMSPSVFRQTVAGSATFGVALGGSPAGSAALARSEALAESTKSQQISTQVIAMSLDSGGRPA